MKKILMLVGAVMLMGVDDCEQAEIDNGKAWSMEGRKVLLQKCTELCGEKAALVPMSGTGNVQCICVPPGVSPLIPVLRVEK